MTRHPRVLMAGLVLAAGLAGCGETGSSLDDSVQATFSMSQESATAALASLVGDGDSIRLGGALIRRALIDSLIVNVVRVDVLPDSNIHRCRPLLGDSVNGFRPGPRDGRPGPRGPLDPQVGPVIAGCARPHDVGPRVHPLRPDSLLPPDSGWGSRQRHWYSLAVVGSGHLDLLDLPTDSTTGLVLASGALPVGDYHAARILLDAANIWFDTTFTTANGFTFQADTPYQVTLPMRRDSIMGLMTRQGFTIDEVSRTVVLTFNPWTTIGNAGVNANGEILIRPVLKPHRPN